MPIKISQLPELTVVDDGTLFSVVDTITPGTPVSKKVSGLNVADFILAGNAATATKLATARNINGVAFDGTSNITITTSVAPATTSVIGGVIVGTGVDVTVNGTISVPVATTSVAGRVKAGTGISVAVDGTISVNVVPVATTSVAGTVIVGSGISVEPDGTISVDIIPVATTSVAGTVIVGSGISVEPDGTISVDIIPVATTSVAGTVIAGDGISITVDGTISTPTRKFHGFSVDADSNLIYSSTTDSTIILQDQYGNDLYEDTDIGTNDYAYSMDANGNLIVTFS